MLIAFMGTAQPDRALFEDSHQHTAALRQTVYLCDTLAKIHREPAG